MPNGHEIEALRRKLEVRFGVALFVHTETVEGGSFEALRPVELEFGNGFAILLSRTHRHFEASFKADNFAGALIRMMSEATRGQRSAFSRAREAAKVEGTQVYVAINGNDSENSHELTERWMRVEIEVSRRIPIGKTQEDLAGTLFHVASTCLSLVLSLTGLGERSVPAPSAAVQGLPEGAKVSVEVNRYERSPVNRAACIEHHGPTCQCCGFDFHGFYGELGDGYIEVHHRTPVSKLGPDYLVDPLLDLVPLCANCHSMVHRSTPPLSVEELRMLVEARRAEADVG